MFLLAQVAQLRFGWCSTGWPVAFSDTLRPLLAFRGSDGIICHYASMLLLRVSFTGLRLSSNSINYHREYIRACVDALSKHFSVIDCYDAT